MDEARNDFTFKLLGRFGRDIYISMYIYKHIIYIISKDVQSNQQSWFILAIFILPSYKCVHILLASLICISGVGRRNSTKGNTGFLF